MKILIDTNIYLGFYRSNKDGIRMATGTMHESAAERDNAIAAVKKYAPNAEVEIYEVVNT